MAPLTEMLRPPTGLTNNQKREARTLCREGLSSPEIATRLGVLEAGVDKALQAMRTRHPRPARTNFNVPTEVADDLMSEFRGNGPKGQVIARLLEEVRGRRAGTWS